MRKRLIERVGRTTGRWPRYTLVVDGVEVGEVARTSVGGGNPLTTGHSARADAWAIAGLVVMTRDRAEAELIARAVRFGHLEG